MLEVFGLKKTYLFEAVRQVADFHNRKFMSYLGSRTRMEALLGRIQDNLKLVTFVWRLEFSGWFLYARLRAQEFTCVSCMSL